MNVSIWLDNPKILLETPLDFFPNNLDSFNVKMNALMRMVIYISVIISICYSDVKYLFFILLVGVIIYILNSKEKESLENTEVGPRTVPTTNNPLMNFTTADLLNIDSNGSIIDRPPILDPLDPKVATDITNRLNDNMYRDVNDAFDRKLDHRQFYTMPNTDLVNDRDTWAKWCYNAPASCKEDSICYNYEDLRTNRAEFPINKQ